jgi:uncharacterized membrane protein
MSSLQANHNLPTAPVFQSRIWLERSGMAWFTSACIGQFLFLTYILGFYGTSAARGQFADWSKHRQVIDGYVAGDLIGNIQFGAHIVMAAILTLGGMLQLMPAVRNRFGQFHRWNGRIFAMAALCASFGGLWLVWVRGSRIDMTSAIGISLNAILIIFFIAMAVKRAREGDFADHQRWAMRAFLAVSGVWFLRVGIMAFGLVTSGAMGLPSSYTEGFFPIWSFGSYLVPLAIYELYAAAKSGALRAFQNIMMVVLFTLTGLSCLGIFGAALVMWLPSVCAVLGL